jgi:hypothetical protein
MGLDGWVDLMPRYQPKLDQIGAASSWGSDGLSGRIVSGGYARVPTEVGLDGSSKFIGVGWVEC